VSTPDLQIIDYAIGLPGSQHDATAFADTRISKEHNVLLQDEEFMWGDSAYPLHKWLQAPYKKYVTNIYVYYNLILADQKRRHLRIQLIIIMSPKCASDLNILLDF